MMTTDRRESQQHKGQPCKSTSVRARCLRQGGWESKRKAGKETCWWVQLFLPYTSWCKSLSPPQNAGSNLQNISIIHFCFRRYGSAAEDDKDAGESQDETHHFQKSQSIPLEEKMSSNGHDKRTQVDKKHGASGICVEQTEVNTREFDSKQEAHHHPMEEHDVLMKYLFSPSKTVDQPQIEATSDRRVDAKIGDTPWFEILIAGWLKPQSKVTMMRMTTALRSK